MNPPRGLKLAATLTSLALFLGAVTTTAVAWSVALYGKYPDNPLRAYGAARGDRAQWLEWSSRESRGFTRIYCRIAYEPVQSGAQLQYVEGSCCGRTQSTARVTPAPCSLNLSMSTDEYANVRDFKIFGWPYPCIWAAEDGNFSAPDLSHIAYVGAINLGPGHCWWQYQSPTRLLPARPIWPEFAKNATLYAAAWTPLLLAPRIKRALRPKPGHCPSCYYNLQGLPPHSPCPECGRAAPSR